MPTEDDNTAYHYPPELVQLLGDTIPLLCRSKDNLLLFFRGAGVSDSDLAPQYSALRQNRLAVNKFRMTREVLKLINDAGDRHIRTRRELLRRVVEFEDFSTCWPDDQLKAKGLVGEIRRVVDVKDAFTRMNLERLRGQAERAAHVEQQAAVQQVRKKKLAELHADLCALFSVSDARARGLSLEPIMNRMFEHYGMLVRTGFRRLEPSSGRVLEQVDGVIELDGHIYLVEMKWLKDAVAVEDVSRHLVRTFSRGSARAMFISNSEFTAAALDVCREALQSTVVTLVSLEEIVVVLEKDKDLREVLRAKIRHAVIDKQPWKKLAW